MALPLLEYPLTTQNQRVASFGLADRNEDSPYIYRLEGAASAPEMDALIWAAYRQVFNEQETLQFNRLVTLETQLRNRAITLRDFIRGLAKSERFYRLLVEPNNNYRLVQVCLRRLLGRDSYSQDEEIAWSIVIATQGFNGFVDALIDSEEYTRCFGDQTVPYQRKRMGDRPFSFTPRYGEDYRDKLPTPSSSSDPFERYTWETLVHRANWPVVSALVISLTGILFFLLLLTSVVNTTVG